jgi:hypothetical protein
MIYPSASNFTRGESQHAQKVTSAHFVDNDSIYFQFDIFINSE